VPVRSPFARPARVIVLLLVTLLVAQPAVSWAADPTEDIVGGVPVAANPELADAAPGVAMPAGVLWTTDGRALWERGADDERAMASTTKIMTALVVLDHADLDEVVTVSARAARVGEAGIKLVAGQQLTVGELLEGTVVRSGNDASFALAEHVGGDVESFVRMMNEKARALGLEDTSFANPHGLDAPNHYTTAEDLATIAMVAMRDPRFAALVRMPMITVKQVDGAVVTYENSNKLIGTYPGATGVKTGWTNKAGYCVVASAERDGVGFVAVVLGGTSEDDRFVQARTLFDWGFEHYRIVPVSSAEETASLVAVTDYLDRQVAALVAETVEVPVFDLDGEVTTRIDVMTEIDAPVVAGQRLGTASVVQGDRLLAQIPLVAAEAVPEPDTWEALEIWFTRLWRRVFGGELVAVPVPVM